MEEPDALAGRKPSEERRQAVRDRLSDGPAVINSPNFHTKQRERVYTAGFSIGSCRRKGQRWG